MTVSEIGDICKDIRKTFPRLNETHAMYETFVLDLARVVIKYNKDYGTNGELVN